MGFPENLLATVFRDDLLTHSDKVLFSFKYHEVPRKSQQSNVPRIVQSMCPVRIKKNRRYVKMAMYFLRNA